MNKNFISLCAGILLGVSPLFAVPAKPVLVRVAQPDGTVVTVKTVGDEFYHYKSTSDGIPEYVAKMVSIVMPSCLQRDWLLPAM